MNGGEGVSGPAPPPNSEPHCDGVLFGNPGVDAPPDVPETCGDAIGTLVRHRADGTTARVAPTEDAPDAPAGAPTLTDAPKGLLMPWLEAGGGGLNGRIAPRVEIGLDEPAPPRGCEAGPP